MSRVIYNKWIESGTLDDIEEEDDRIKLMLYFTDLYTYFNSLTDGDEAANLDLEAASFPIVIRVFQLTGFNYDKHPATFVQDVFKIETSQKYHHAIMVLDSDIIDAKAFRLVYVANEIANSYGR